MEFVEDRGINVLAKMEYAPVHDRDRHIVRYNPDKPYVSHLLVHELMHLELQIANTKAGKGMVIYSDHQNGVNFDHHFAPFFNRFYRNTGKIVRENFRNQVLGGMGTLLSNGPVDLFVEDKIFKYEDMRPAQMLSLMNMEQENIRQANSKKVASTFPKEVTRAVNIINMCSSLHLRMLYGLDYVQDYNPTKVDLAQATDLFEEYKAYISTFHTGDEYELVDYFAASVDMEDYITIGKEDAVLQRMREERARRQQFMPGQRTAEDVDALNARFALDHQDGANETEMMMMSMYMLGAMEYLDKVSDNEVKAIAMDIAMTGLNGIHPKKRYKIATLENKEFGGYQLLAYYYVSWARAYPEHLESLQMPYTKAYDLAMQMYRAKHHPPRQ